MGTVNVRAVSFNATGGTSFGVEHYKRERAEDATPQIEIRFDDDVTPDQLQLFIMDAYRSSMASLINIMLKSRGEQPAETDLSTFAKWQVTNAVDDSTDSLASIYVEGPGGRRVANKLTWEDASRIVECHNALMDAVNKLAGVIKLKKSATND